MSGTGLFTKSTSIVFVGLFAASVYGAQLQTYVSGLSSPLFLTSAEDGTRRTFIIERGGRLKVFQPGSTTPTVFLDISSRLVSGGERGLLGLAFHPDYALNRRFFVNYTRIGDGATVIAEYQASASNPNVANTTERVILVIGQPFANHNGGMIDFGPDGNLYIGMGDGGSGNDPGNRAQNIEDLLGKMLRINVDQTNGPTPYLSPSDNPFVGVAGRDEIWATGLRNPWRWSFDRGGSRDLILGDVGQDNWEEINIITRNGNYGWRIMEGDGCNSGINPNCTQPANYVRPIAVYTILDTRCTIIGGYVYRGLRGAVPQGAYIYADYCTGEIFQLNPPVRGTAQTRIIDAPFSVSSFGEDEAGEIYVLDLAGTAHRITASPSPAACNYTVSPLTPSFDAAGGSGSISVTTGSDCGWMAARHESWITLNSGRNGAGNGSVAYSIAPNTSGSARTGTITVAGATVTINQSATSNLPRLRVVRSGSSVQVSWPTNAAGFTLESTARLPASSWAVVTTSPSVSGTNYVVTQTPANGGKFYRLRKP